MNKIFFRQDGFTLLEVLISITILAVITIVVGKLVFGSFSLLEESKHQLNKTSINQGKIEELLYKSNQQDKPIAWKETLSFKFKQVEDKNLAEYEVKVEGGTRRAGDIEVFLPSVPAIEEFKLKSNRHVYGDQPKKIEVILRTNKVADETPVAVKLVKKNGSLTLPKQQGTIIDNKAHNSNIEADFTYDLSSSQLPPGYYNAQLWVADLAGKPMASNQDYIVDPIRMITVGGGGNILTSGQGNNWSQRNGLAVLTDFNDVVWGGEKEQPQFVAVGDGGIIMHSPQGKNWTQPTNLPTQLQNIDLQGITWVSNSDDKKFIAVGDKGAVVIGNYNSSLHKYEWSWKRGEINSKLGSMDIENINLKDAAYGGPTGEEKLILVGDNENILIYDQDEGWQARSFGGSNWYSIAWADIKPEEVAENKSRKCFFLAGEKHIFSLKVNKQTGKLSYSGKDYSQNNANAPKEVITDMFIGAESCFFVGKTKENKLFYVYKYDQDKGWICDYLSSVPVAGEDMSSFKGVTFNNDDIFVVGKNSSGQSRILRLAAEKKEWQPIILEESINNNLSLNEITAINK